jgi:hypothetical protein
MCSHIICSQGSLQMMLGMSGWFHAIPHSGALMFGGLGATLATAIAWWRDAIIEGDMGMHTEVRAVVTGQKGRRNHEAG